MKKYFYQGKLIAKSGSVDELKNILFKAAEIVSTIEGSQIYAISTKQDDPDAVYVFEVWESKEAHDSSLQNQEVKSLIMRAVPLLSEMPKKGIELDIVGGIGI